MLKAGWWAIGAWALVGAALLLTFNHAMQVDKTNLCGNDATAYEGCGK